MKRFINSGLYAILVVVSVLFGSCSSDLDDELAAQDEVTVAETVERLQLSKSNAFNSLSKGEQATFVKSFVYDDMGQIVSFHLDQEENSIGDEDYNELICLVLRTNVIGVSDVDETRSGDIYYYESTNVADNTYTGNPPLVFKNRRNNNVGGCDKFKGSVCIIRW